MARVQRKSKLKKIRVRYRRAKAVDGDTLRVLWNNEARYIRIVGVDTHELSSKNKTEKEKAEIATHLLDRFFKKIFKPKIYAFQGQTRDGWPYLKAHSGRLLCKVYVWRYIWYVDYAEYIIKKQLHKKRSKWNGEKN